MILDLGALLLVGTAFFGGALLGLWAVYSQARSRPLRIGRGTLWCCFGIGFGISALCLVGLALLLSGADFR